MKALNKFTFSLSFMAICFIGQAQNERQPVIESGAVALLDKMSLIIGELESVHYELAVQQDINSEPTGEITTHAYHKVYVNGPDKMQIYTNSQKGKRAFWYNGQQFAYYSFDENNYSILPAPPSLIAMFDSLHNNYGIDFPAADVFYPAFTDDLIEAFPEIVLKGVTKIDETECFHVVARNMNMTLQLWITNDPFFLPKKFVINYHNEGEVRRYEAQFNSWEVNPILPEAMFEFNPPAGAREIIMLAKD